MFKSPILWIILAVLTVSGAVVAAGAVKDTRDRVLRIEQQGCQTPESCKRLLGRLLRFAGPREKRALVEALPIVRERLRRQVVREEARDRPEQDTATPPRTQNPPAPAPKPSEPVPGPPGPRGPEGPAGRPAPSPTPVPVPETPETPEQPEVPDLPPLPPIPPKACDLLPTLCPQAVP
jgi:hypothetical protein